MTVEHATPNESASQVTSPAPESVSQATESSFAIPEEYKDRGWVEKTKGWTGADDLFKAYDNAQTLIGKRPAGIPSTDASDADWDTFYKAAGRPDEAKYEFTEIEGLPEGFDSEGYKATAAEILHGAGLSQKQADKVYQAFMANELKASGEQTEKTTGEQKVLDEQFDALTKEHFDGNYDAAEKTALETFKHHVPQSMKDSLEALENHPEALAAVVMAINGIKGDADKVRKEYGAEGSITTGTQVTGTDAQTVRSELADVNYKLLGMNFQSEGYDALLTRQTELRAYNTRNSNK